MLISFEDKVRRALKQAFDRGDEEYNVFIREFTEVVEDQLAVACVSVCWVNDSGFEQGFCKLVVAVPMPDRKIGLKVLATDEFHISIMHVELVQDKLTIRWRLGKKEEEQERSLVVV